MTVFDDETLMRRADGELSAQQADDVDAAVASDPAAAGRLASFRTDRKTARDAFPIVPDPRDAELARLVASVGRKNSHGWIERLKAAFIPAHAPMWGGMATACFVGGLAVGWLVLGQNESGFSVDPSGDITNAGLVKVLDQRLASDGADGQGRAVILTFRNADGQWCRTFQAGEAGVAGLACHHEGGWAMAALAPFKSQSGEVRTASSDTPAVILAAVDAMISGETLDGENETKARAGGWT